MISRSVATGISAVLMLLPMAASAHSGNDSSGFIAGFLHPIFGYDHLLAMLSVGIVSAQLGGRAIWTVPALFVTSMVVGGALGVMRVAFPFVEEGVALSVIILGLGIIFSRQQRNVLLTMLFVAFFGALHGHAHGVEMPNSASPVYYSFGFVISTSLIHLLGVLVGYTLTHQDRLQRGLTYLGAGVSGIGCFLLVGRLAG